MCPLTVGPHCEKPCLWGFREVRLKPACSATATILNIKTLYVAS